MSTRTVRLDDEAEKALEEVVQATGLTISGALKQGILILRHQVSQETTQTPYDVYAELDLGPGGYAIAPAAEVRQGVRDAIGKKLGR